MLMMFVKNKSLIATYQSHILPPIKPEHNITGQVVCWQTLVRGTVDKHIETFIKESYGREYHSSEVLHQMFNCRMLLYCGGTKMNLREEISLVRSARSDVPLSNVAILWRNKDEHNKYRSSVDTHFTECLQCDDTSQNNC